MSDLYFTHEKLAVTRNLEGFDHMHLQAEYLNFMKYFGSLAKTMQTLYLAACKHS